MHVTEDILAAAGALVEPSHAQARGYLRQLKDTLDEQENLRASLAEERAAVADKYSRLDADFAAREELRKTEFEAALGRIINEFKIESDCAVRTIKDRVEAARIKRATENQAAELRRKSARLSLPAAYRNSGQEALTATQSGETGSTDEIHEGDRVKIQSLDREGIVESIREETYVVIVGALRYRADRNDLTRTSKAQGASPPPSPAHSSIVDDASVSEVASELKVIGLAADDAVDRIDKFLDQAFLAGIENVRIIHGHGKGILRKAIAEFLSDHRQVERFSLAPPEKGGGGATIVELKK
jgi:DNA mismatch repair protein MutS2